MTAAAPGERRLVVFGAGAVGRGFIAPLFASAGWHVTFLDVSDDLIDRLNHQGGYRQIVLDNESHQEHFVQPVTAARVDDVRTVTSVLATADFAATAVGARNLAGLAPLIVSGLRARQGLRRDPLDFLICENLHDATSLLRQALNQAHGGDTSALIGLAATSIGRMIPSGVRDANDPTAIGVEPYSFLPYDASALLNPEPAVPGLVPVRENFDAYVDRKLYVHNMGHCMLAYLAKQRSLKYVWEAAEDLELRSFVRAAMNEAAAAVSVLHGMPLGGLLDHVSDLLKRFGNRKLQDTAERVGRDPVRKMQHDDRLLGAHRMCRKAGIAPHHISLAVALGALQLETEAGWKRDEVDAHLDHYLFDGDDPHDRRYQILLADQRRLLEDPFDGHAHLALLDQQYAIARTV